MADLLRSACLAFAMLTASCVSSGDARAQSSGDRVDAGEFQLEGLPAQVLEAGRCGLFLWSKSARPVFILYAAEGPALATVRVNGKERSLKRTSVSGERVYGHFEKQAFAGNGVAFEVDLTFDANQPIQDGAVIKTGMLRTRSKRGVETMVPVGGMVGCQKASSS